MKIVFLGPPGAGKGTQAVNISKRYGIAHIATGDMLREHVRKGTELGKIAKGYMESGGLVPDDVIVGMIVQKLAEPECEKGCLFDGFPRTIKQAEALSEKVRIDAAVNIDVADDIIIDRLSGRRVCKDCGAVYHISNLGKDAKTCANCGGELIIRSDDNAETVKNRLKVYHEQTSPLIEYYKKQNVLVNVDGSKSVDEVFEEICSKVDKAIS